MSEREDKYSKELDALAAEGDQLFNAIQYETNEDDFRKAALDALDGKEEAVELFISELPNFRSNYQAWYSKALAIVSQVLPDRVKDFTDYYEYPRVRKELKYGNYRIRDYLRAHRVTRYGDVVVDESAAVPEFQQQLNIVKAAKESLNSVLMDLGGILQADLFDGEIDAATVLAKSGHLRAAGALCGVVIEKHLLQICKYHNITVKKKNPGIADLSELLKNDKVIDLTQWRHIQLMADIRNLCDHAKSKEPTKEQLDDLLAGSNKILKTIY